MNLRELVILLLGLAIIGVVIRGLLVALKARRNQLKLAIDKNIPRDVDLEALEFAELPSGGARVVKRKRPSDTGSEESSVSVESSIEAPEESLLGDLQEDLPVPLPQDVPQEAIIKEESEDSHHEPPVLIRQEPPIESQAGVNDENLDASQAECSEELLEEETVKEEESVAEQAIIESSRDELSEDSEPDVERKIDPVLGDDDFTEFTLSAGERIGGREVREEKKPKRSGSLLQSARRTLGTLITKPEAPVSEKKPEEVTPIAPYVGGEKLLDESELVDAVPSVEQAPVVAAEVLVSDAGDELFEGYAEEEKEIGGSHSMSHDLFPETIESVDQPKKPVKKATKQEKPKAAKPERKSKEKRKQTSDQAGLAQANTENESTSNGPMEDVGDLSEVLVINVTAKKGRLLMGDRLMPLLLSLGLKFGDMKIFNKRVGDKANGDILFNVANMLNPGTFDLNEMERFNTIGVTLFLALPTSINNLDAFNQMLETAQELVQSLDGELRDDQRNMMTAQTIEHYRQRVRDFELQRLRARAAAG